MKNTIQLENGEGLDIELSDYYGYSFVSITVNGYDYAQFQGADMNEIDLRELVLWIENTYYSGDYMTDAYIPCDLSIDEFKLNHL